MERKKKMKGMYRKGHPYKKGREQNSRAFHLVGDKPIYEVGGFISKEEFKDYRDNFKKCNPFKPEQYENVGGHLFGLGEVMKLISQPGCHGIRIYYGLKKVKKKLHPQLMIVGVYKDGADMTDHTLILDASMPCPDYCDPT